MIAEWKLPNELEPILERLAWFEPLRSEGRTDWVRFLQMAMAYAREDELDKVRLHFSIEQFRDALRQSPAGIFDRQSWEYWHKALGLPPEPLPRRPFVPADFEPDERFSKCVVREYR
jgi:hypothetical protein